MIITKTTEYIVTLKRCTIKTLTAIFANNKIKEPKKVTAK